MNRLPKWKLSGMLTNTRTCGAIRFVKNGDFVDIWIRVNGKEMWHGILIKELVKFLNSKKEKKTFLSESEGNAEAEG